MLKLEIKCEFLSFFLPVKSFGVSSTSMANIRYIFEIWGQKFKFQSFFSIVKNFEVSNIGTVGCIASIRYGLLLLVHLLTISYWFANCHLVLSQN